MQPAVQSGDTSSSVPLGLAPSQIRQAYGFDQVTFANGVKGDGAGQTIAIVDAFDDPTIAADLRRFDRQFGIVDPPGFTKVNQSGGSKLPAASDEWSAEIALDVEWAHAIAPGANIILVEANSASVKDLAAAVDTARRLPGVSVISMSWGIDEFAGETAYDALFTTPGGHNGVTFVAATGDSAESDPQWPAVSPNVLAVGGSSLTFADVLGTYGIETYSLDSTSGTSRFEGASTGQMTALGTSSRSTPDVSYNVSGYAVYNSAADGWQVLGGTSAAAPQWAALIAIADQGRALQGLSSVDGATSALPALYGAAGTAYNTLSSGSATSLPPSGTSGLETGLGTPQAAQVVQVLSGAQSPAPASDTPYTPPGATAQSNKRVKPFFTLYVPVPRPLGVAPIMFSAPQAINVSVAIPPISVGKVSSPGLSMQPHGRMPGHAYAQAFNAGASVSLPIGGWLTRTASTMGHWLAAPIAAAPASAADPAMLLPAPIQAIYRFAQVNAAATFSDALGAFINECAAITPATAELKHPSHTRAWVVTAVVVMADVILIHHTLHHRTKKKQAMRPPTNQPEESPSPLPLSQPLRLVGT